MAHLGLYSLSGSEVALEGLPDPPQSSLPLGQIRRSGPSRIGWFESWSSLQMGAARRPHTSLKAGFTADRLNGELAKREGA